MKGIFEDKSKSVQMLINSIGASNYNILSALIAPKSPTEFDYEELVKVLENHLAPKKNPLVSQHYFLSTYQKQDSSISEYVSELRRDIADCKFTVTCECSKELSVADVFLRAQFIRGIKDSWIKEQILQSELTDFNDIVNKAIALEASKIESRELSKSQPFNRGITNTEDINKISKSSRQLKNAKSSSTNQNIKQKGTSSNQRMKSNQNRIDFEKLGINNLCLRCGNSNHLSRDCRVNPSKLKCRSCHSVGHVQKVCIRTLLNSQRSSSPKISTNNIKTYENTTVNMIVDIFDNRGSDAAPDAKKYFTSVKIENRYQKFEIDTGAGYTLIPESKFKRLEIKNELLQTNIAFRSYTENVFLPLGKVRVKVEYNGRTSNEDLYVVPDGYEPLLGRVWVRHLKINLEEVDQNTGGEIDNKIASIKDITDIEKLFPEVFEQKVGCVPNFTIKLRLRDGAKPIYTPERNVPYALREKVEKELDALEAAGIISKSISSDWGSPLVVIPKGDGSVRLCVDYKVGVNDQLINVNYPIKKIDEVLNSLRDSKYFCKLDLYKAYLHLQTDEESSIIQTMSTHRGTYRMNRLSFGIKTAPAEFNRIIDQILKGLSNTIAYFDDIVVHGKTKEECLRNLLACLERLRKYDLHVNSQKCSFFQTRIEYLGHVVENNKILKSPSKVEALIHMRAPKNVQEVRQFLGMVTYYSRFIPDVSTITYPLRKLLWKNQKFCWTKECDKAFIKLKNEISSDRVLVPFNPELPVTLATDASPVGISAVLSHSINEEEKPIAFASRSLTEAERNYSQLDREALAIIFGVSHFFDYLYGRHFVLITDNKPLSRIFHRKSSLPKMTSARLLRYASYLTGFDYAVKFRKGLENQNADCLSRAPISQHHISADMFINDEVHQVCASAVFEISTDTLTADAIIQETEKDQELAEIKRELQSSPINTDYILHHGILFKNNRIVIPKSLQAEILKELHSTHIGITKMKQLARRYCIWKNIDQDIEKLVKSCKECLSMKHSPVKAPIHHWDIPVNNWDRIHIDYAGPFQGFHYLLVIDAKSRWVEIKILQKAPTSEATIKLLNEIFATHGYPLVMVSDNASIFTHEVFEKFCRMNGIRQKFIAPGHPATNGLAERNVQTLKDRLKSMSSENLPINLKVQKILFRYRATPLANNKSPAELYLNRRIRIKLDAMFPFHERKSQQSIKPRTRILQVGEKVRTKFFANNKPVWKFGIITQKFGHLHYLVKLDEGREVKRHINQLQKSCIEERKPLCNESTPNSSSFQNEGYNPDYYEVINPHSTPYQSNSTDQQMGAHDQQQVSLPPARRSSRVRRPPAYLQDYVQ